MPKEKKKSQTVKLRIDMADWETEDSLLLLRGWKRDGFQDNEIAKKIGVTPKTICEWKRRSKLIRDALNKAREQFHKELEEAMYKRALGYYVDEWVEEYRYDKHGNEALVYKKKTRKHIPPSETMQIFIAKHDIRGKWNDDRTDADKQEQAARIAKLQKEAKDDDKTSEIKITIEGGDGYAD